MEEKYMVNDILENMKNNIQTYSNAIVNSSNMSLRQTIQTLRNDFESFEYELLKLSESKGYYISPEPVKQIEIDNIKNNIEI